MFRVRTIARHCLLIAFSCSAAACSSDPTSSAPAGSSAGAPGSVVGCVPADADSYQPGMTKLGDSERFNFALLSSTPAPPALNDNTFRVQVRGAGGDEPQNGELSVLLEMPEHGHMGQQPSISFDSASQVFTLEPMRLFMVGLWRFTFSFAPDAGNPEAAPDSAVFKFCVD